MSNSTWYYSVPELDYELLNHRQLKDSNMVTAGQWYSHASRCREVAQVNPDNTVLFWDGSKCCITSLIDLTPLTHRPYKIEEFIKAFFNSTLKLYRPAVFRNKGSMNEWVLLKTQAASNPIAPVQLQDRVRGTLHHVTLDQLCRNYTLDGQPVGVALEVKYTISYDPAPKVADIKFDTNVLSLVIQCDGLKAELEFDAEGNVNPDGLNSLLEQAKKLAIKTLAKSSLSSMSINEARARFNTNGDKSVTYTKTRGKHFVIHVMLDGTVLLRSMRDHKVWECSWNDFKAKFVL